MNNATGESPRGRNEAERALTDLLRSVDLSAPSSTKFDPVRAWIATRAGLDPRRVSVYWVSKPGNFDVRFRQPGVLRDKPVLGVALVPGDENLDGYAKPARRLVENGLFKAIALCSRRPDGWAGGVAFVREDSEVDATAGGLISDNNILTVWDGENDDIEESIEYSNRNSIGTPWRERERLEGLDGSRPSVGWGDYPLDAVFVRTETRTVSEVVKRIRGGRYQLDPDFQREFVWTVPKQSRLIESCIMRIPLPVFYVAEARDGRIIVVDGLQRLTTFTRFLNDEFALSGLDDPEREITHPLSGLRFSQLPLSLSERIEDTQLTLYVLDAKAPERAKLDIFERVNSGDPLSRQQMRNCLFNGAATRWLKLAAQSPAFLTATGQSLDAKRMRDREAINRFCAFWQFGWEGYRSGDMDGFLARALERMNEIDLNSLERMMAAFERSMELNQMMFGRHAFRKSLANADPDSSRSVMNIALFDVCSVTFAKVDPEKILLNFVEIQETLKALISDEYFNHAITYSTNSTRQVRERFSIVDHAVGDLIL